MPDTMQENTIHQIDTGIEGAEPQDTFNISDRAIEMIQKVREENNLSDDHLLRIGTQSGGCSGISYALGFDEKLNPNDKVYSANDLKLVVDNKSVFYLMGVTLDYTEGPQGTGFIFQNPNNFNTCGCHG